MLSVMFNKSDKYLYSHCAKPPYTEIITGTNNHRVIENGHTATHAHLNHETYYAIF